MKAAELTCDYLVVGSGAVGMAFADVLINESDAKVIIVDRYAKPGGHWNLAYPFVTLHQPSAFYGVSSRELNQGYIEQVGLNKGLMELASGDEVSAYFNKVMHEQFIPSGRVEYFPMCEYKGDGQFTSVISGKNYAVKVNRKIVDATFLKTSIPATHTPSFTIDDSVEFIPVSELPSINRSYQNYIVVGGGKTGIDACLWLLENHVDPDAIKWVMPRDAWLLDRKNTQPSEAFFFDSIGAQANQMQAIAESSSIDDLYDRLEEKGVMLRIDKTVRPSMFHGATVTQAELEQLRRIKNIVRKGRISHIGVEKITLDGGEVNTPNDAIFVDCSASALTNLATKAVFEEGKITPQTVRAYQPVFSAAVIAHTELAYPNDDIKNKLMQVVPLPNRDIDWIPMMAAMMRNSHIWSTQDELKQWIHDCRLDGFAKLVKSVKPEDKEKSAVLGKLYGNAEAAAGKLQQYMGQLIKQGKIPMPEQFK